MYNYAAPIFTSLSFIPTLKPGLSYQWQTHKSYMLLVECSISKHESGDYGDHQMTSFVNRQTLHAIIVIQRQKPKYNAILLTFECWVYFHCLILAASSASLASLSSRLASSSASLSVFAFCFLNSSPSFPFGPKRSARC